MLAFFPSNSYRDLEDAARIDRYGRWSFVVRECGSLNPFPVLTPQQQHAHTHTNTHTHTHQPNHTGIGHASAWAAGRLTSECWDWLLGDFLGAVRAAQADGGVDAV